MQPTRIIEPYAGTGAYSVYALALEAERTTGRRYRREPPVSRVGSKAGFAPNVFRAWGLNKTRWTGVHLNDLDPVCHLMHLCYASGELRDAVARRIWAMVPCPVCNPEAVDRAMAGELRPTPDTLSGSPGCPECSATGVRDARRLWEKTRSTPVPGDIAEALASGLYLQHAAWGRLAVTEENGQWRMARENSLSTLTCDPKRIEQPGMIAERLEQQYAGLATLADVTAQALFMQSRSFQLKPVTIEGGAWSEYGMKPEIDDYVRKRACTPKLDSPRWTVADRVENLATGCTIHITRMDARHSLPPGDLSDAVVILDPPYAGTTGYAHESGRADILSLAAEARDRGALVLLHEAAALAKDLGAGWVARQASPLRSRESTFWADGEEREFITASRAPIWWPAQQTALFGG